MGGGGPSAIELTGVGRAGRRRCDSMSASRSLLAGGQARGREWEGQRSPQARTHAAPAQLLTHPPGHPRAAVQGGRHRIGGRQGGGCAGGGPRARHPVPGRLQAACRLSGMGRGGANALCTSELDGSLLHAGRRSGTFTTAADRRRRRPTCCARTTTQLHPVHLVPITSCFEVSGVTHTTFADLGNRGMRWKKRRNKEDVGGQHLPGLCNCRGPWSLYRLGRGSQGMNRGYANDVLCGGKDGQTAFASSACLGRLGRR